MAEQTSKADRVKLNRELAQMLKGGVIMDVTTPEQAKIADVMEDEDLRAQYQRDFTEMAEDKEAAAQFLSLIHISEPTRH